MRSQLTAYTHPKHDTPTPDHTIRSKPNGQQELIARRGQEEVLVVDDRASIRPAQCVEDKINQVLGYFIAWRGPSEKAQILVP